MSKANCAWSRSIAATRLARSCRSFRIAGNVPITARIALIAAIEWPLSANQVRDSATQRLFALKTLHPTRAHDQEERAMLVHERWLAQHTASVPELAQAI